MKIIENSIIPPKGFAAINLFGVLFVRKGVIVTARMVRHETIHTRQMQELLFVPFYILYVLEWLVKLCFYGNKAYRNISFEREAYSNDKDTCYFLVRRHYAFLKYIF
jgi:hypothetical protein